MLRNKLSIESLEVRVVLNAAPVLVRDVGDSSVMVATAETTLHQPLISYNPDESGYDGATTQLVHDFTGDGVDDVFVEWNNGEWGMRVNDGSQLFLMLWGAAPSANSEVIDTADFNNDGLDDVLSFDRVTGDVWVSLNSLNDGFTNERWSRFTPKTEWTAILVEDFDGDGWVDVLGGETGGGWWLAKNVKTDFNNHYWAKLGKHDWQDFVSEDFSGDGIADVAVRAADNTWWLWAGRKDSQKSSGKYFGHWKMRDDWYDVSAADFDGDGKADVIGRTDDGRLWVGSAGEDRFVTKPWGKGWIHTADWTNMSIVDMNGDDRPDQVGKASDGTWWYAENNGENFRNNFWQKSNAKTSFVSTNFFRDVPLDLAAPLNGNQPNDPVRPVSVTINDENQFVVTGSEVDLLGLEFRSQSGSLVPATNAVAERPSNPEFTDPAASPFSFFLVNEPDHIALGNLSVPYKLDGSVTLNVGWDPLGQADLIVNYGQSQIAIAANVDDTLELKFVHAQRVVDNRATYRSIIHGRRNTAVANPPAPVNVTPPAVSTPVVSSSAAGDVKMTLNEDGLLVVTGSNVHMAGIDLVSPSGSLVPAPAADTNVLISDFVDPAAPFQFLITNTANQVFYGNLSGNYILNGSLTLSVGWNTSGPSDLVAHWGDGATPVAIDVDDVLSAEAVVSEKPTPVNPVVSNPVVPNSAESDVKLTVNDEGFLVVTGPNLRVAGIDLMSAGGSLIPVATANTELDTLTDSGFVDPAAAPFQFLLANTANQVTYGNLGRYYLLDGSLILSVGWNPSGPSDLIAQWGDGATPAPIDVDDALDADA